jgi:hypothetical protein
LLLRPAQPRRCTSAITTEIARCPGCIREGSGWVPDVRQDIGERSGCIPEVVEEVGEVSGWVPEVVEEVGEVSGWVPEVIEEVGEVSGWVPEVVEEVGEVSGWVPEVVEEVGEVSGWVPEVVEEVGEVSGWVPEVIEEVGEVSGWIPEAVEEVDRSLGMHPGSGPGHPGWLWMYPEPFGCIRSLVQRRLHGSAGGGSSARLVGGLQQAAGQRVRPAPYRCCTSCRRTALASASIVMGLTRCSSKPTARLRWKSLSWP